MISKVCRLLVALLGLALLAGGDGSAAAQGQGSPQADAPAATKSCRIGRRAYCYKYKGICEREGKADCNAWFDACWQCHDVADRCRLGGTACETCRSAWSRCMAASYKTHWPSKARK